MTQENAHKWIYNQVDLEHKIVAVFLFDTFGLRIQMSNEQRPKVYSDKLDCSLNMYMVKNAVHIIR